LAFGFTTLNRWWKAGGRIAMRLCGGNVPLAGLRFTFGFTTLNRWWRGGGRVLRCDYVVEM
ncbi:hypothetical protein T12_13410, partial [Trichinella patagoniensis]